MSLKVTGSFPSPRWSRSLPLSLPNRKRVIVCVDCGEKRNYLPLLLQQRMSPLVNNKKGKSLPPIGPHIVCFQLDMLSDSALGAFGNPIKQQVLRVGTAPHQIQIEAGVG